MRDPYSPWLTSALSTIFEAGRSVVRVTPIVLTRSDGNHRFYDPRRCQRWCSDGRDFLRCTARADMAASVAGMLAIRRGRPKGGAANQHVSFLPHKETYGGKDRTVEMGQKQTRALQQNRQSFNHFIGKQLHLVGNGQTQRLRSFHIDDEFELGCCL
jgi:hypothetical protein